MEKSKVTVIWSAETILKLSNTTQKAALLTCSFRLLEAMMAFTGIKRIIIPTPANVASCIVCHKKYIATIIWKGQDLQKEAPTITLDTCTLKAFPAQSTVGIQFHKTQVHCSKQLLISKCSNPHSFLGWKWVTHQSQPVSSIHNLHRPD